MTPPGDEDLGMPGFGGTVSGGVVSVVVKISLSSKTLPRLKTLSCLKTHSCLPPLPSTGRNNFSSFFPSIPPRPKNRNCRGAAILAQPFAKLNHFSPDSIVPSSSSEHQRGRLEAEYFTNT